MFIKASKEFENNSSNKTTVFKKINEIEAYFITCMESEYINCEIESFLNDEDLLQDFELIRPDIIKVISDALKLLNKYKSKKEWKLIEQFSFINPLNIKNNQK